MKTGATPVQPTEQPLKHVAGTAETTSAGTATPAVAYLIVAIVGVLAFVPSLSGDLIADDWMLIARNMHVQPSDVPGWFVQVRHDWYRPVQELTIAGAWRAFGRDPLGYRVLTLALYGAVIALVGLAGERLSRQRSVGLLAAVVFASLHFHAEPASWFAAANELLAALFSLGMLLTYIAFRRSGFTALLAGAVVCYLLALGSKESTALLPLVLVTYEVTAPDRRAEGKRIVRRLLPVVPFIAVGLTFLIFRLAAGNPYPHDVTVPQVIKNVGHYATLELLAWPIDFDYTAFDSGNGWTGGLALVSIALAAVGWLLLVGGWFAARPWRANPWCRRSLAVGAAWGVAKLVPVLPIVTERTAFLSSIAVAWFVATLAVAAWRSAHDRRALRTVVAAAVVLLVLANGMMLQYRAHWWTSAGTTSSTVMTDLAAALDAMLSDQPVVLVGLPDHERFAYVFRNALPHAGQVLGHGGPIEAVLATDTAPDSHDPTAPGKMPRSGNSPLVFIYKDGHLVPAPQEPAD